MKLIDSSVWIKVFRRRSDASLGSTVASLISTGDAAINGVIFVELLVGARDTQSLANSRDNLLGIPELPMFWQTWEIAAELGFRLRRLGLTVETPDVLIAASAIEHDVVLMHADSDFDRIAQHTELKVESYVA
jgi:predicted nucleic acid-binding protein